MLQNLLPNEQKKSLEVEYYTRLVTVVVLLLAGSVMIGIFALVPGYIHIIFELQTQEKLLESQKENIEDTRSLAQELSQSSAMLTFLEKETSQEKLTTLLREVLRERPSGIVLTGFSYNRNNAKLSLQAVAATRDLVVPYTQAIEASTYFETAPVPLSDLAKNTNLEFHLNVTVAEQKE